MQVKRLPCSIILGSLTFASGSSTNSLLLSGSGLSCHGLVFGFNDYIESGVAYYNQLIGKESYYFTDFTKNPEANSKLVESLLGELGEDFKTKTTQATQADSADKPGQTPNQLLAEFQKKAIAKIQGLLPKSEFENSSQNFSDHIDKKTGLEDLENELKGVVNEIFVTSSWLSNLWSQQIEILQAKLLEPMPVKSQRKMKELNFIHL